ncbi:hypothetical protein BaRGS_00030388 [Batillaria attramentaria]|uniref:Uncharacterized protein n=1 Tax=Batillaria attramentaria TaxID=370345 RepID=A0ABD0JTL4_9CAEN
MNSEIELIWTCKDTLRSFFTPQARVSVRLGSSAADPFTRKLNSHYFGQNLPVNVSGLTPDLPSLTAYRHRYEQNDLPCRVMFEGRLLPSTTNRGDVCRRFRVCSAWWREHVGDRVATRCEF